MQKKNNKKKYGDVGKSEHMIYFQVVMQQTRMWCLVSLILMGFHQLAPCWKMEVHITGNAIIDLKSWAPKMISVTVLKIKEFYVSILTPRL